MYFYCEKCKKKYPISTLSYRCRCGGLFRLFKKPAEEMVYTVSIGEIKTPLVRAQIDQMEVFLKMEQLQPTGSFKGRGAYTLINQLKNVGIKSIVEDSSGNAATAIAAYAAAAGIECSVYLPAGTSAAKINQISAYGAKIKEVEGSRDKAGEAARAAAQNTYYASHVYNPLFFEGTKSLAYEIYEQMEFQVPEYVFMPVGNGSMLLGLYYGFIEIGRLPKFIAVQSENCCPVYQGFYDLPRRRIGKTVASGIRVGRPPRLPEILMALHHSQGDVVTVSDDELLISQDKIGRQGLYAEATAAAAFAGARKYFAAGKPDNYRVIIPLTGSGLKK